MAAQTPAGSSWSSGPAWDPLSAQLQPDWLGAYPSDVECKKKEMSFAKTPTLCFLEVRRRLQLRFCRLWDPECNHGEKAGTLGGREGDQRDDFKPDPSPCKEKGREGQVYSPGCTPTEPGRKRCFCLSKEVSEEFLDGPS